ncbi:hypothetical protein GDO86_013684, partial [Hymenochirus boettgeri]
TCHFLNSIFLFLFRELRDNRAPPPLGHQEDPGGAGGAAEEPAGGRLLEGLSLRDVSLGDSLRSSALLSVRLGRVRGPLRLVFTRIPFPHWAFTFLQDPDIELEVQSQFEGRPMSQLTSIIVTQLKKVIKRKHTVPNYKIRYKPFFPVQVQSPDLDLEDRTLFLQDLGLTEGRLKVSALDCSRLLIFGSYDQETYIHCTLELSSSPWKEKTRTSIKTVELIKGNSQSSDYSADLKKGDRLIAIGDVKVTSSVQASKLIKQAGDRTLVFYERPAGLNQNMLETFGQLEETAFGASSFPQTFEEDAVSIIVDPENKELDSEFEELACEIKPTGEPKEDGLLLVTQSPKRIVANISTKPLGSVSPILNRKLNLPTYQSALKTQPKMSKVVPPESTEPVQQNKASKSPSNKPPVPPRPQVKLTLTSCENTVALETGDVIVDKPERPPPPSLNGEKQTEKCVKNSDVVEDTMTQKSTSVKQDVTKDKVSESSCNTKDSVEDPHFWESPEMLYRNRQGRWTRASCVFDVEGYHRYLNVALWCRDSLKTGSLCCVGHISIKLEDIALECLATSSMDYLTSFRLNPPEPRASVSRTALRNLSMHKGFNEKYCYGDITLNFKYLMEGESETSSMLYEKERDMGLLEDLLLPKEELPVLPVVFAESKHNFQDTQFQNSTLCDYCKKKVWTKAASQCMVCGYVCHKKCQEKCLAENPYCVAVEKRVDLESKSFGNRTTGITRHILNTSSRLLNLRQAQKTRQPEQGSDLVEPSPKHTPTTSDNESSDTETCGSGSPSKRASGSSGKLARKEGGLDDSVFIAVKEIGRDLYRGLPTDERIQKLEFMLDKLQNEIDQELEHNNSLVKEEKDTTDTRRKALLAAALLKSGERLQALTLLMIHYRAGIEDIESLENSCLAQPRKNTKPEEAAVLAVEAIDNEEEDNDIDQQETEIFNCISSEEKALNSPEVE